MTSGVSGKHVQKYLQGQSYCTNCGTNIGTNISTHFLDYFRYIESGLYQGITEKVFAKQIQESFAIPPEKLVLLNLYTHADLQLYRMDKPTKDSSKLGKSHFEYWYELSTKCTNRCTNCMHSNRRAS